MQKNLLALGVSSPQSAIWAGCEHSGGHHTEDRPRACFAAPARLTASISLHLEGNFDRDSCFENLCLACVIPRCSLPAATLQNNTQSKGRCGEVPTAGHREAVPNLGQSFTSHPVNEAWKP